MAEVRRCTIAEIEAAPNLDAVLSAYASEGALPEIGQACPQWPTYRQLEAAGAMHPIGVFEGDNLLGFIVPLVVVLPHYGVLSATVESFFVLKDERSKGLGSQLRIAAESLARGLGAKALLICAPVDGALARGLHCSKAYRHSNEVFVRALV